MADPLTPSEERAALASVEAAIDAAAKDAFEELKDLIRGGMAPRDAVAQVMAGFQGDMAATLAAGLSAVMAESVGTAAVLALQVGTVQLSTKLYAEALEVGNVVQGIVTRHAQGFLDARRLALELFEGYGFRAPDAEPLQIKASNPKLPRYLADLLRMSPGLEKDMAVEFARIQVNGLSTDGLRAAYSELLDAIGKAETTKGAVLLETRLETAFFERVRYFANRIAQTELHRAYTDREAKIIMADVDIEFVQLRRAPGKGDPCICALLTGRNIYGLGPGVYPKAICPRPGFHPFCRCVIAQRLDLTGRTATAGNEQAEDVSFLRRLNVSVAARIMGSEAKLKLVTGGQSAESVFNMTRQPAFKMRKVGG